MKPIFVESVAVSGAGRPDVPLPPRFEWSPPYGEQTGAIAPELRRATPLIRSALHVVARNTAISTVDIAKCRSVFACSDGDMHVIDNICQALSMPGRPVSPTQFHNVVHNAPAGHWSLAAKAVAPSISLGARYESFAVGLLEAFSCLYEADTPVVLASYTHPGPVRIDRYQPRVQPFAASMVLQAERTEETVFSLILDIVDTPWESTLEDPYLETLRIANPTARGLPLLAAMAAGSPEKVGLPLGGRTLAVTIGRWDVAREVGAEAHHAELSL